MSAEPTPKQAIAIGIVAIVLGAGIALGSSAHDCSFSLGF
jgi:hypothetical protein